MYKGTRRVEIMEENPQDGGGFSLGVIKNKVKKQRVRVIGSLQQLFIDCGWKKNVALKLGKDQDNWDEEEEAHINSIYMDVAMEAFRKSSLDLSSKSLEAIGLKRAVAVSLYERVEPLLLSSFTLEQLFELCLECTLGKHSEYRPGSRFLYNQEIEHNRWTSIPNVKGLIYNRNGDRIEAALADLRKTKGTAGTTIYYHTTSWRAFDIIGRVGIDTSKCRTCCDFGISPSFYLTPSIAVAIEYAEKRAAIENREMCIMAFALPVQLPLRVKWFKRPSVEWGRLVASSRICEDSDNALDKYDFIYGPMCANPNQVRTKGLSPMAHSPVKYQLATKYDSRRTVAEGLIGTVFLDKGFGE